MEIERTNYTYAVIGGGIAGVSCVEQILEYEPESRILLVSSSPVVKVASEITRIGKTLEDFLIVEKTLKSFKDVHHSVRVVHGEVSELHPDKNMVITKEGEKFTYRRICICSGASPKILFPGSEHVVGIRDTESVAELARQISKSRKILLLGNGGIATELVHEVDGVDIVWAIKDKSISTHFVDPGAAEFFIQSKLTKTSNSLESSPTCDSCDNVPQSCSNSRTSGFIEDISSSRQEPTLSKRRKYTITSVQPSTTISSDNTSIGSALGPDWHQGVNLKGQSIFKNVKILYETECTQITHKSKNDEWPISAELSNGTVIDCDLVISATGVIPNCSLFSCCDQDPEKGIFVDSAMKTSALNVFSAGDVCHPTWAYSKHWFHMRLWTQARQMGLYAGKSMMSSVRNEDDPENQEDIELDFCFELFSHVTRFFGFKVVLIGLYNGQGLDETEQSFIMRCTKNLEYIKVVLVGGKMQGALLIGETGLEETFENLILNQLDLTSLGEDLLNPDIDIEDYFD